MSPWLLLWSVWWWVSMTAVAIAGDGTSDMMPDAPTLGGGAGVLALLGFAVRELAALAKTRQSAAATPEPDTSPIDHPDIIRAHNATERRIDALEHRVESLNETAAEIRTLTGEIQAVARRLDGDD